MCNKLESCSSILELREFENSRTKLTFSKNSILLLEQIEESFNPQSYISILKIIFQHIREISAEAYSEHSQTSKVSAVNCH